MAGMLNDKVAFITGAASGIGAGTAERFAEEGARVVIADVQAEAGQQLSDQIGARGGQALYVECDVSDPGSVQRAVAAAVERFGGLDIVFANAGINGVFAPIDELQPDEWTRTHDINLKGTYLTVHFAVPHLKRAGGGSIIITSSVNGTRSFAYAGASAYSTSKAGQVAFMKMMALELGPHNIRCNAVCPGAIRTNIGERTHRRNTEAIGIAIQLPNGSPAVNQGRGQPSDVADVCLFLASNLSRHVSGVEIFVDGGASLVF
jgi:NAD(P)-dependent dehydrogenase (short-subunit alcohol dehydrogenase family)